MNPGKRRLQRAAWARMAGPTALALLLAGCSTDGGAGSAAGAQGAHAWPPAPALSRPPVEPVGPLPSSVAVEPTRHGMWDVTFTYVPAPTEAIQTLVLAGTFNSWNVAANRMSLAGGSGAWSTTVRLGPGEYQYKFVRDGQWIQDPQNDRSAPDNFGGHNSVLRLGRAERPDRSPATAGDGEFAAAGLQHDPASTLYLQEFSPARLLLRYRTYAHDVESVAVALRGGVTAPMHVVSSDPVYCYWEAAVDRPRAARDGAAEGIEYTFLLTDGKRTVSDPSTYTHRIRGQGVLDAPQWAVHAIWYQIMPDRFRNGDRANDPPRVRPWTSEWFTPSPWEGQDGQSFYRWFVYDRLYGGDIAGIEWALAYLKDLGVNALYLNPVFQSRTHHKYDAANYLHVDEHLGAGGDYAAAAAREDLRDPSTWTWTGSDRRFLEFLKKAKSMGFRVIIDGVFNHVGVDHPAFQDVKQNGRDSPYADWFEVTSWEPFAYAGWAGHASLPVFRKSPEGLASESAKKHIFDVTRRWMDPDGDGDPSDGVDGWRLDVPNEIAMPFWREWCSLVRSINPEAYITGEIWDRADAWLDGRHFDAVMNYPFARAVLSWVGDQRLKIRASELDQRLAELRLAYPAAATYVMQNLVDSHDTDRLASMLANPDRQYDHQNRVQDSNPDYDNRKPGEAIYRKARLVALLQMTYIGAPMVYYGDEVGMWGADDPTNRKPMLWADLEPYEKPDENFVMTDQLEFYRRVIALRNELAALRVGSFQTVAADDLHDVWAFLRETDEQRVLVVLNASEEDRNVELAVPGATLRWRPVFGGPGEATSAAGRIQVPVPAVSGVVLVAAP